MRFNKNDFPLHESCDMSEEAFQSREDAIKFPEDLLQDDKQLSSCSPNWMGLKYIYFTQSKIPQLFLRSLAFNEGYDLRDVKGRLRSDNELCGLVNSTKPNNHWLQAQKDYIDRLSQYERDLIQYYTYHGNNIINAVLRGDYDKAYKGYLNFRGEDEFIEEYMNLYQSDDEDGVHREDDNDEEYKDEDDDEYENDEEDGENNQKRKNRVIDAFLQMATTLNEIIEAAPPLDKDITVYRGVDKRTYFEPGIHVSKSITSTSLWIDVAMIYLKQLPNKETLGYIGFIRIPKGSNVLFIGIPDISVFPWEKEILIPQGSTYKIYDDIEEVEIVKMRQLGDDSMPLTYGFCLQKENPINVLKINIDIIS
jgi:hypothetical protein